MKSIILLSLVFLAGCDLTQVPEEHRAAADSLIRADSTRKADSVATIQPSTDHVYQVCISGEDRINTQEWEDPLFWGDLKVRVSRDTIRTGKMHSDECWPLGTRADTAHLQVLQTGTATRFDSVWVQVDTLPERFFLPWHSVQLHPDSLRRISDSVWVYGIRGLVRRGNFR